MFGSDVTLCRYVTLITQPAQLPISIIIAQPLRILYKLGVIWIKMLGFSVPQFNFAWM